MFYSLQEQVGMFNQQTPGYKSRSFTVTTCPFFRKCIRSQQQGIRKTY